MKRKVKSSGKCHCKSLICATLNICFCNLFVNVVNETLFNGKITRKYLNEQFFKMHLIICALYVIV
jgi:hypothetical protein